MQYIYSNQNRIFKAIKKLKSKKYRIIENKILLEGVRLIEHARKLGIEPELICYDSIDRPEALREREDDILLESALFKQISDTVNSQGVLAIVNVEDMHRKLNPASEHIVVVNGVQDPGNLGTILRTCDAFGFDRVILSRETCDPYSLKTLRSSMGGIFGVSLKIGMKNQDIIQYLRREGYQIVVSSLEAEIDLKTLDLQDKFAIVLGNEANGVDRDFLQNADLLYKIGMRESAESLNVGVAAAITLHALSSYS